jgi:hypothetical protein
MVDSLKALDPYRPIREATVDFQNLLGRDGPILLKNLLVETVKAD